VHPFEYHRALSVADAAARLDQDDQAKLLAGGMTLLPTMKLRLATPTLLVDIGALPELRRIELDEEALTIGAGVRHAQVADSATVRQAHHALAHLAQGIGDPQVRHRGTLGGSLANNDPAADYPAAVLALDATVITNRRRIAATDFLVGMFQTALQPNEIIEAVRFRRARRAAYAKFAHPASGYAMAGVFVAELDGAGGREIRVAVTGAGPGVFRWEQAEAALAQRFSAAALETLSPDPDALLSDLHAPADYRANLTRVMAQRAVARLTGEHQ
jgi:aerobic carbon-monoxide dehydrogenase medium subunit